MGMVKNIIINNIDRCNVEVIHKILELQSINFLKDRKVVNEEKVKCAKIKIKNNSQICIINSKYIKFNSKGTDNTWK